MGRRAREERREQREDKVAKQTKVKRKNNLKAVGILALIAVIVGYAGYEFINIDSSTPGGPPNAGSLGDEHEHASLLVRIFGDKFDFAVPSYQIKNSWIHFEDSDGTTIHRHSSGVTLGYLFDSLRIDVDNKDTDGMIKKCFIFPDGRQFCDNEDYRLKFYINHVEQQSIYNYVLEDGDRILITYGNETPEQIEEQLLELDSQIIRG
uniref:Protein-disulfide isomerase n=2 Tax=environmental samples TaxID=651140 RepID=A0A075HCI5_9ARCH|nr:hypothetical protein [uncultured marine thaumarchaeote KM3_52_F05]AIF11580.1 hypothetical protein [uncultured marine thaumarchaeote KM3_52_H04]